MVVTFRQRATYSAVIAGVLTAIPLAVAFTSGAGSARTGGPSSNGAGCNACHPHESGSGSVQLVDAPRRYRAGQPYDFSVRVSDADQVGAGFEISVEQVGGSVGTLQIIDSINTKFADGDPRFITHKSSGVADSLATWSAGGDSYEYFVGWDAPASDVGPLTFFVSGLAINNATSFAGDNYYWTFATAHYAMPGDADGDGDLDLSDFAVLQQCFGGGRPVVPFGGGWPYASVECAFLDMGIDGSVDALDVEPWTLAMDGPTATNSAGYVLASAIRGGRLYDRWWREANIAAPAGDHPLYPAVGVRSGTTTFRCKECHGWDYKGVAGAYASGSHFTGIAGVIGSTKTPQEMFALLKADPIEVANGHDMDAYGMSDSDLWDVIRFLKDEVVDTDDFIDPDGTFPGDLGLGQGGYGVNCTFCHGSDGKNLNFGTALDPEYVGTVGANNPWELLHMMRFGHAGTPMPSTELIGWTDEQVIAVAAYAATLPVN